LGFVVQWTQRWTCGLRWWKLTGCQRESDWNCFKWSVVCYPEVIEYKLSLFAWYEQYAWSCHFFSLSFPCLTSKSLLNIFWFKGGQQEVSMLIQICKLLDTWGQFLCWTGKESDQQWRRACDFIHQN
jgi:hypothetical protein